MALPPGTGKRLRALADRRLLTPKIQRTTRRGAVDRKFGRVSDAIPKDVQVVADWQLHRQVFVYSPRLNTSIQAGQRVFFRWEVPNDQAWWVRGLNFNLSGPAQGGVVRLQLQVPLSDLGAFETHILGELPMPASNVGGIREVSFVGVKPDAPYFAPGEPFYVPSGSVLGVFMLRNADATGTVGVDLVAFELPPTQEIQLIEPKTDFV